MQTRHLGVKKARQSQPEELEVDLRNKVQNHPQETLRS